MNPKELKEIHDKIEERNRHILRLLGDIKLNQLMIESHLNIKRLNK